MSLKINEHGDSRKKNRIIEVYDALTNQTLYFPSKYKTALYVGCSPALIYNCLEKPHDYKGFKNFSFKYYAGNPKDIEIANYVKERKPRNDKGTRRPFYKERTQK